MWTQEQKREYSKNWRKTNQKYIKEYRQTHKEQQKEYDKNYRKLHPEKWKEYWEQYKLRHPEYKEQKKKYDEKHAKKYRLEHLKQFSLHQNIYRQKLRLQVLVHYGGDPPKCACCGESEYRFLTIDHINNDGYKEGHKRSHIFSQLKRNNYPKGYQVLCYNCNCGRAHNNGVCPHKEGD